MKLKEAERDVSASIVEYFSLVYKIQLHRRNTGAFKLEHAGKSRFVRFSSKGQADLWGIQPETGRHIEIEVKATDKTPSEDQIAWLASCREKGAIAFWADSLDMAIAEYELQALDIP